MVYVVIIPWAYLLSKHLSNWYDQAPAQFIYWISLCFRQFTNDNGLETNITTSIALSTGSICASLGMIPNQPIVFKVGCVIKVTYLTLTDRWNGCFNNSYKPFSGLCLLFYLYILICVGICIICDIYNIHTLSANICKQKKGARENDELFWSLRSECKYILYLPTMYVYCVYPVISKAPGWSWSWSYGSWIYNYLCNQCLLPLKLWVRIPFIGTPVSSTNNTDRHDITEILWSGVKHDKPSKAIKNSTTTTNLFKKRRNKRRFQWWPLWHPQTSSYHRSTWFRSVSAKLCLRQWWYI
jgi:hypothetical protein